ncbi:MAG: hypothetical protein HC944_01860, partial [Nanoarchaeota archaeon]|nr:hypothetical protein [Nanoarchaeota archaeon]
LRLNEEIEIKEMFEKNFNVNFTMVDAVEKFLSKLKGVEDPEKKGRSSVKSSFMFLLILQKIMVLSNGLHRVRYIQML